MIPREKIDELLKKIDLSTVVSKFIDLQKRGKNYWGVCPFHQDTSPSMSVSNEKGVFTCFSCKETGNVISFVEKYKKISFVEAVKEIALIGNIELGEIANFQKKNKYSQKEEDFFKLNEEAEKYFKIILKSEIGAKAYEYFTSRGFTFEMIEKWCVGFCPKENNLAEILIKKGYNHETLVDSGLFFERDGLLKSYFNQRVIFPIKNEDARTIGFSGRVLDETKPKYINTPETLIFKKSHLAFNIDEALKQLTPLNNKIIVLEGFMDVIALDKINVKNAIALMGTALSSYHIKLFKKNKIEPIIFLDGDVAGINATIKLAKNLILEKISFKIANNDTKKDPDELIEDSQFELINNIINNPVEPLNYVIDKLWRNLDNQDIKTMVDYIDKVLAFLNLYNDPLVVEMGVNKLVNLTKLEKDIILDRVKNKVHPIQTQQMESNPTKQLRTKILSLSEKRIIHALGFGDHFFSEIENNVDNFTNNHFRNILRLILKEYREYGRIIDLQRIINKIEDPTYQNELNQIINHPMIIYKIPILSKIEITDFIASEKIKDLKHRHRANLTKMKTETNDKAKESLLNENEQLTIIINELRKK